ncbi:MAG: hypothetical protein ABII82_15160, partial [Verrucomicrobiota bacterium]
MIPEDDHIPDRQDMSKLTESVKELARQHGAALVGVAPIERFDPMPPLYDAVPGGHHPRDFLPEARSVISIAQPILSPAMDAPAVLATRELEMIPPHVRYPYFEVFYNRVGHLVQDYMLEFIAQIVGQFLLARGHQAMIFPTTGLHPKVGDLTDVETWEGNRGTEHSFRAAGSSGGAKGAPSGGSEQPRPGAGNECSVPLFSPFRYTFGPFSHRHAATRAGLGEFGYNNLVLTRQFGPRQRFNSIVTDAELTGDPLISEPICLRDRCNLCRKACIVQCITMRDDAEVTDYRSVERLDRGAIFIDTP